MLKDTLRDCICIWQQRFAALLAAMPGSREEPYVFDIVGPATGDAIAASLSTNVIKLYALQQPSGGSKKNQGGLQHVGDLRGHTSRITDVRFPLAAQPHAIFSCSLDGTLKGWDARSGQIVEECVPMRLKGIMTSVFTVLHHFALLQIATSVRQ